MEGERHDGPRGAVTIDRRTFVKGIGIGAGVLAGGGLLAACGGGGGGDTAAATASALTGPAKGNVVMWAWEPNTTGFKKVLAGFKEVHPDVTVEIVEQPYSDITSIYRAANAAKSGPDAMFFLPDNAGIFQYTDHLMPLNEAIPAWMKENLLNFEAFAQDRDTSKSIFAVPTDLQGLQVYYNKQHFRTAGLDPDAPPATFDELVEAANALKKAGIVPFGGGNKEGYIGTWNIFWLLAGTADAAFATGLGDGSVKFTDPIFHATCERVVRMYQDGWFPKGANSTPLFTDGANAFAKGEGAMLCGLVSDPLVGFPIMIKEFGEENVGVMPPVVVEGDRPYYIPAGAGEGWGIPTYSGNPAAAWAFMEYVVGPEQQRAIFDEVGLVPANKATSLEGAPQPLKDIVAEFDEYGASYPLAQLPQDLIQALGSQMQGVFAGGSSLDDALAELDRLAEKG